MPLPDIEDVYSEFLFVLAGLQHPGARTTGSEPKSAVIALFGSLPARRLCSTRGTARTPDIGNLCFAMMLEDRAVEIISEKLFSRIQVLYDDTAAILKEELEAAEIFLAGFNVKIAAPLGIEPITSEELEECLLADAPKEADAITSLARAKAELRIWKSTRRLSLAGQGPSRLRAEG